MALRSQFYGGKQKPRLTRLHWVRLVMITAAPHVDLSGDQVISTRLWRSIRDPLKERAAITSEALP
jgi:hypothetical protein